MERLEANWRKLVKPEDTIVLAGDISWAMRLTDTRRDFEFLQQLPGQKLIMKGNHDYWWTTANKMNAYLKAEGFAKKCRFRKAETVPMEVLPGTTLDITTWEKLWR